MHQADPFARDYMAGIGHFDFGRTLRPVNFGGWLDHGPPAAAETLEFWLRYWLAAYGVTFQQLSERVRAVCYESLTDRPVHSLSLIAAALGTEETDAMTGQAARLHPPRRHSVPDDLDPDLLERAQALYRDLCGTSLI
jgi:ABC-type nitrate/sulfonate/bicarbonate transport system substrate-binding protein